MGGRPLFYGRAQDANTSSNWFSIKYLILSCVLNGGPCMCSVPLPSSLPFISQTSLPLSPTHQTSRSFLLALSSTSHSDISSNTKKMAKFGKLTKLKSAIKRWPSITKLSRNNSCVSAASSDSLSDKPPSSKEVHAVYVGKSRRRYLVSSDVIDHPVFQELVGRSSSSAGCDDGVVIACEVVLFEHLLWMLESAETQLGSMDELVEFYTCAC